MVMLLTIHVVTGVISETDGVRFVMVGDIVVVYVVIAASVLMLLLSLSVLVIVCVVAVSIRYSSNHHMLNEV